MIRLSKIDDKLTIYKGSRVVLFGSGKVGREAKQMLEGMGVSVYCFCDNDPSKWNTMLLGIPIISPEELKQEYSENMLIQITTGASRAIEKQLKEMGITAYISYEEFAERIFRLPWYHCLKREVNHKEEFYSVYWENYYRMISSAWKNFHWECAVRVKAFDLPSYNYICLPPKTGDHTLAQSGILGFNWAHTYKYMSQQLQEVIDHKPIKIIMAVRDVISQNISEFFERIGMGVGHEADAWWVNGGNVQALFDGWLLNELGNSFSRKTTENIATDFTGLEILREVCGIDAFAIQNWFEKNFEQYSGIDIYQYPFDQERGYSIIKIPEKNVEIFIYQVEKLDMIASELGDFLGMENLTLANANVGEEKWYADAYRQAKKELKFSRAYFDACFDSKIMKHFYSDADIEKFKARWISHVED